ncbi:MAG: VCBS repeat-containing protein [Bacteroidales bacterium]|nr:VCBS repeat-containing protein [Bacteroidales bacterium]
MMSNKITVQAIFFVFFLMSMLTSFTVAAQSGRYYWVGKGDGTTWNSLMNWSATSGGAGGAPGGITDVPTPINTVVFDENSTLISTRRVSINGAVQCDSLIVENCTAATLPVFYMSYSASLTISGSLFLQAGVSFTGAYMALKFFSNRSQETIDADGVFISTGSSSYDVGQYTNNISTFSGSGAYKLASDANFGIMTLNSGMLDLNGKNLSCNKMSINSGGNITFVGSTIECRQSWENKGSALTSAQTANSLIRVGVGSFTAKAGDAYHNVEFYMGTTSNSASHGISTGTYNKITILKGKATLGGTSSSVLTTDSLIISAMAAVRFQRVIINNYFEAKPAVCGGQIRLYGTSGATAVNRTITMGAGAHVAIERAVIHDLIITGAAANAGKSYNWGNNQGITFTTAPDAGKDLYWTGGSGYWGDPNHWLVNGIPANCIPTLADNVFFDAGANTGGTAISSTNPVYLDMEAWCNNMTWNGVPGTPRFQLDGNTSTTNNNYANYNPCTDNVMIGGSLTLQSSLRIGNTHYSATSRNGEFWFVGDSPGNTITTHGVPLSCSFVFQSAAGTGGWKIMDNLVLYTILNDINNTVITTAANFTNGTANYRLRPILHNRGNLDMSNITVIARSFKNPANTSPANFTGGFSDSLSSRTLNIANATIDLLDEWICLGGQQLTATQSAGSLIVAGTNAHSAKISTKDDDYYYNVELRKFAGGYIRNDQSNSQSPAFFNKVTLSGDGATISRTGGAILPDSLLFTGYGTYTIARNMMVNKYVGTPVACGGLSTITSASPVTVTLGTALPHAERVKIRNTNIQNISIAPADTLYGVIECNFSGTSDGWINRSSPPQTFYWVGRAGNWNDSENWSLTSGLHGGYKGDGTGCVPGPIDNVIFDDGSFNATTQRVTVNTVSYCDSMYWIGSDTLIPQLYFSAHLYISGSAEFQRGMTIPYVGTNGGLNFVTNRSVETIKTNGAQFELPIYFNAANKESGWKLLDSLSFKGYNQFIEFMRGTLDLNGKALLDVYQFNGDPRSSNRDNRRFIIANSTITFMNVNSPGYDYSGDLDAENSNIIMAPIHQTASFKGEADAQYHNLEIGAGSGYINQGKFNKITASGNVTFGDTSSPHIETDTLILSNSTSYIYKFYSGSRLTVHEAYYGSGSPCSPIYLQSTYLQSTSETIPAIFDIKRAAANYAGTKGNGTMDTLMIDYAYIHGIRALTNPDNAFLYKAMHCPDVDRSSATAFGYGLGADNYNQDWARMDAYGVNGTSPFGDLDRILACEEFPYLLGSENFAPTPTTRFKWFKMDYATFEAKLNATPGTTPAEKFDNLTGYVSTDADILITGRGTFSLIVDYGNGCVSWDDIKITTHTCCAPVPLPVTSPQTFCVGSTVSDLQAEGEEDGIIHWYRLTSTDTVRLPGNTLLEDGATYYATQQIDSCESVIHDTIKALVLIIPKPTLEHPHPSAIAQSISSGSAITDIVYDYGGSATGATVSFTPPTGHSFSYTVDTVAKTVTIHGSSSMVDTVTYTVTALAGTYCADSVTTGTITVTQGEISAVPDHVQILTCYPSALIDVLANDTMIHCTRGEMTNFTIVRAPATGTVDSVTANINIAYSYPEGFTGRDTLTYELECNHLICTGSVFITVIPCPDNIDTADCVIDPMPREWGINPNFLKSSELVNSYGQPYVGDVDGCGRNEVLVWNYPSTGTQRGPSNAILIFNDSLRLKYTIGVGGTSGRNNSPPDLALAFAKTNPSNTAADIFVVVGTSATNGVLKSYSFNGATWGEKWANTTAGVAYSAAINIGDINNDGEVELYVDHKIFNANTGKLLLNLPAAPKGKREGSAPVMNLLADMDNDGTLEAVAGTKVYQLHIINSGDTTGNGFTVLYELPAETLAGYSADGFTSVADINQDGYLDIVVSTDSTKTPNHPVVLVWNTQTDLPSLIGKPVRLPGSDHIASRVFVGDVDSDGYPELAAVSMNRISCYELNDTRTAFVQKWARTISDNSAETYMCMFDFNQDDKQEIVYRDEQWLHILDGETGADKTRIACFSPTDWEGPIVADLNGDGHAQIIVTGNDKEEHITSDSTRTYLRVYTSSKSGDWAPARSVWNQYSYNAVNINEDLTVPQFQLNPSTRFPNGKRPYNNFLQQQTLLDADGNPFWLAPNIVWAGEPTLTLSGDSAVFNICIENIGDAALQAPIYVSFYKNDTTPTNFIALDSVPSSLPAGSNLCFKLVVENISDYAPFTNLWISVNDKENVYPYQQQCETSGRHRCVTSFTLQGTVFPFLHTDDTAFDTLFMVTAALYEEPAETVGVRKLKALLSAKPLHVDTLKYYDSSVYIPGTPKNPGDFMRTDNPGLPIDWSRLGRESGTADTATVRAGDLPTQPVGYYSFTVPPGEYVLVISRAGYLARYAKIVIHADSYLGHRELLPGDLNASRNVTVADLSLIKACQSIGFGDGLYKARYDLDGNKTIGQQELDMVLFYMGATYLIYPESRIWLYGE